MDDTDPHPPQLPRPTTSNRRDRGRTAWFLAAVTLAVLFVISSTALVMLLRDRSDDSADTIAAVPTTVTVAPTAPPNPDDEFGAARAEVLRQLVESSRAEGVTVDDGCLREVVTRLSEDDARLLAESGIDDAEVSEQGDALAVELFGCISFEWYLDEMVRELEREGLSVDRSCLESELADFDFRELGRAFREDDEPPEQLSTAGATCSR